MKNQAKIKILEMHLNPSEEHLGAIFGSSWGRLGAILGSLEAILGRLGAILGRLGVIWEVLGSEFWWKKPSENQNSRNTP